MSRRHTAPSSSSAEELLNTLGQLTGRILERIKMQQARVELAAALQRHTLRAALPAVPGLRVAGRYAPARDGLDIGGDWYDVFPMPDGSVGCAIGDVQGHDVEAAAYMGQVRTCLRAVAVATTEPAEVLARTNDLLISMGSGLFVTCTFLRFDPATCELVDARAGHVPAVWATDDGRCEVVLDEGACRWASSTARSTRRPAASWPAPVPSCWSPTAWWRGPAIPSTRGWPAWRTWPPPAAPPTPTNWPPG